MQVNALSIHDFLAQMPNRVVLDVRSPKEYNQGHIPGAISFPLFTDDERHAVGLCYKQKGSDTAILLGLELVGPKLAGFVQSARQLANGKPILLYCWRGGMRSNSMAILLKTAGMPVSVLKNGYKAYRKAVLDAFEIPYKLINIGGFTGTGKTEYLKKLHQAGHQVLDLEHLAGHHGSAFGNLSTKPQPTTEHFENLLARSLMSHQPELPLFIEDESMAIGQVRIPLAFYRQMQKAPLLFLQQTMQSRLARLVQLYGSAPKLAAQQAFIRLEKRLGGQAVKSALAAIEADSVTEACRIALDYYDKTYYSALENRAFRYFTKLNANLPEHQLLALIEEKTRHIYGNNP